MSILSDIFAARNRRDAELLKRIRKLNDTKIEAFTIDGVYYGAPKGVLMLIDEARGAHELREFNRCEDICDMAEVGMQIERMTFRKPP
jgi:hypothetical protein